MADQSSPSRQVASELASLVQEVASARKLLDMVRLHLSPPPRAQS